jgi:uncharacterized protein YbjT (DUF2867 family)
MSAWEVAARSRADEPQHHAPTCVDAHTAPRAYDGRMRDPPLRRILVTGGTGNLGRHVVVALDARPGVLVRVLSRRERPSSTPAHHEWTTTDLVEGELEPAVSDLDAVIHLASEKGSGAGDVMATRRLLAAAKTKGIRHAVVISIVGCNRIPLPFYASKRAIEEAVRAGGVPWTIVRVAQFHSFVERLVSAAATSPIPTPVVSDLRFQPVDEQEVADRLVELALGPAVGDAPDMAGPEVLTLAEIAAMWLSVKGRPTTLVPVTVSALGGEVAGPLRPEPWVRGVLDGYREAWNTPRAERTLGRVRFADWLRHRAT